MAKFGLVRGESKFEFHALSVNLTLRGWGGQPIDAKDCIRFLRSTRSKFDDAGLMLRPWGGGGSNISIRLTVGVGITKLKET